MKNTIGIIQELIEWFEKYLEANPDAELDINSFIIWLHTKLFEDGQRRFWICWKAFTIRLQGPQSRLPKQAIYSHR